MIDYWFWIHFFYTQSNYVIIIVKFQVHQSLSEPTPIGIERLQLKDENFFRNGAQEGSGSKKYHLISIFFD